MTGNFFLLSFFLVFLGVVYYGMCAGWSIMVCRGVWWWGGHHDNEVAKGLGLVERGRSVCVRVPRARLV